MALIRKRLAVEMWIFEQLQTLYGCTVSISLKTSHTKNPIITSF